MFYAHSCGPWRNPGPERRQNNIHGHVSDQRRQNTLQCRLELYIENWSVLLIQSMQNIPPISEEKQEKEEL